MHLGTKKNIPSHAHWLSISHNVETIVIPSPIHWLSISHNVELRVIVLWMLISTTQTEREKKRWCNHLAEFSQIKYQYKYLHTTFFDVGKIRTCFLNCSNLLKIRGETERMTHWCIHRYSSTHHYDYHERMRVHGGLQNLRSQLDCRPPPPHPTPVNEIGPITPLPIYNLRSWLHLAQGRLCVETHCD